MTKASDNPKRTGGEEKNRPAALRRIRRGTQDSIHSDGARAGDVIGDFRLDSRLASGGQGEVWEATQTSLSRKVALKLVLPDRINEKTLALFAREARAGGRLSHPGIVAVHGYGEDDGRHWIAQELVEGSWTLRDFIDDVRKAEELPEDYYPAVTVFLAELADALQAAHNAGHHPSRREAPQHPGHAERSSQADGLRTRAHHGRGGDVTDRRLRGNVAVHEPRASDGEARRDRPPHGHLLARCRDVRDARTRAAVRWRHDAPDCRKHRDARSAGLAQDPLARAARLGGDLRQGAREGEGRAFPIHGGVRGGLAPAPGARADPRAAADAPRSRCEVGAAPPDEKLGELQRRRRLRRDFDSHASPDEPGGGVGAPEDRADGVQRRPTLRKRRLGEEEGRSGSQRRRSERASAGSPSFGPRSHPHRRRRRAPVAHSKLHRARPRSRRALASTPEQDRGDEGVAVQSRGAHDGVARLARQAESTARAGAPFDGRGGAGAA